MGWHILLDIRTWEPHKHAACAKTPLIIRVSSSDTRPKTQIPAHRACELGGLESAMLKRAQGGFGGWTLRRAAVGQ
jgi:hypothetical protein